MPSTFAYWITLVFGNLSLVLLDCVRGRPIQPWLQCMFLSLVVAIFLHSTYCLVLYPRFFTPFRHLPTPKTRSLFTGNEAGFFRERKWVVARRLTAMFPNAGLIRYYVALNQERLLVTSPEGLSEILVRKIDDYDHPAVTKFATMRVTGNGLQFAVGNEHKTQRKHLMPAFSPVHVKTLIPSFWEQAAKMVNGIQTELDHTSEPTHLVSLTNWSIRAALDIIGIAGMGTEFNSLGNPDGEHKLLTEFYREVMSHSSPMFPWIGLLLSYINPRILLYLPEKRNQSLSKAFGDIRQRASKIIEARKERLQGEKGFEEGKDIITVALRSGMFSPETLLDHVMTSLVVGHISTSITYEWVMFELGQRPEMQSRLREEIRASFPDGMASADTSDIESLPYLNAVCSEVLRFYPPLPFALRVAVRNTSILGTSIPRGTMIAYCPDAINHDKRLWGSDADVFNPERWMGPGKAANGGAANNFAFMTFSAGPRNCIGQWWERAELACLVAATIGKFEVELANPDTAGFVEPVTAMISREGIFARIKPIEGW